jgi:SAM-dependent methyltransferase
VSDRDPDVFSRSEYRRVIAWPERIRREAPFLERMLSPAPSRTLLDVGCGTGEHARHFAEEGWRAVGIDVAGSMISQAQDHAGETASGGSARFELRDAAEAAALPEAPFGAALCLGNTLAFVEEGRALGRFLRGIAAALSPGGILLLQMLNYERIESVPVRALPVNVRPIPEEEGGGEIVFVRVFAPRSDGTLAFFPITLALRPGREPLVEVKSAREATHRPWKRAELIAELQGAGFGEVRAFGGMSEIPYEAATSPDLVLRARRP